MYFSSLKLFLIIGDGVNHVSLNITFNWNFLNLCKPRQCLGLIVYRLCSVQLLVFQASRGTLNPEFQQARHELSIHTSSRLDLNSQSGRHRQHNKFFCFISTAVLLSPQLPHPLLLLGNISYLFRWERINCQLPTCRYNTGIRREGRYNSLNALWNFGTAHLIAYPFSHNVYITLRNKNVPV